MVKTVLLSEEEYNLVMKAREELLSKGLSSLEKEVDVKTIEEIQKKIAFDRFTRGAVIGLCAALLVYLLAKGD